MIKSLTVKVFANIPTVMPTKGCLKKVFAQEKVFTSEMMAGYTSENDKTIR